MIGIITAMPTEASEFSGKFSECRTETVAGISFCAGTLKNSFVVLASGGIGKVNAALCAQAMIDRFGVGIIFNCGVAGGLRSAVSRGGVVVADGLVQYDVDTTAMGDPKGFVSTVNTVRFEVNELVSARCANLSAALGYATVRGTVASGDRFLSDSAAVRSIARDFGAVAFEMEAAAIAQVCMRNRVEFVAVKGISDYADDAAADDYQASLEETARIPQRVLWEVLK